MSKREIKNAVIDNIMLGVEDHGILTFYLSLDYGSGNQDFGGYELDTYNKIKKKRVGHRACSDFILKILEVVGVKKWEELRGQYIRVDAEYNKIHGIGNILKDKWFYPEDYFNKK